MSDDTYDPSHLVLQIGHPTYGAKGDAGTVKPAEMIDGTGPYDPGVRLDQTVRGAVLAQVERYRLAWEKALVERDKNPVNWQEEFRARALYAAALQLQDLLF